MMEILAGYCIISLLIAFLFLLSITAFKLLLRKLRVKWLRVSFMLAALSLLIVLLLKELYPDFFYLLEQVNFQMETTLLVMAAVVPTAIISFYSKDKQNQSLPLIINFIDGMAMEVLMRLLVQNAFSIFLFEFTKTEYIITPIILTSLVFAQFILIQTKMKKQPVTTNTILEIIASVWFSLCVGYLYFLTENILIPMIIHGVERWIVHILLSKPERSC